MEVSASRRRGVQTPIIACRGLRSEERRHYRIAMAGEKSGPTVHDLSAIPTGSMSVRDQMPLPNDVRSGGSFLQERTSCPLRPN
jgi:hypothetical protein